MHMIERTRNPKKAGRKPKGGAIRTTLPFRCPDLIAERWRDHAAAHDMTVTDWLVYLAVKGDGEIPQPSYIAEQVEQVEAAAMNAQAQEVLPAAS